MRKGTLWLAVILVSLLHFPARVFGANPDWIVVFNLLQPDKGVQFSGNRVFSCSYEDSGAFKTVLGGAGALLGVLQDNDQLKAALKKCDDRWISSVGDQLDIYVILNENDSSKVSVDEKLRKSQISTDLSTLLKVVKTIQAGVTAANNIKVEKTTYLLAKERATLTVSASLEVPRSIVAAAASPSEPLKTEVITGPTEHWFLSADLPVNSVNQLKFDEASNQVVAKDDPSRFYLGIDWRFGDLFKSYSGRQLWKGFVLKGMVLAQKKPLESYGIALAYRWKPGAFSPFIGWTFTKEDDQADNGTVKLSGKRNSKVRFGLSFNIDQALTWLKSD